MKDKANQKSVKLNEIDKKLFEYEMTEVLINLRGEYSKVSDLLKAESITSADIVVPKATLPDIPPVLSDSDNAVSVPAIGKLSLGFDENKASIEINPITVDVDLPSSPIIIPDISSDQDFTQKVSVVSVPEMNLEEIPAIVFKQGENGDSVEIPQIPVLDISTGLAKLEVEPIRLNGIPNSSSISVKDISEHDIAVSQLDKQEIPVVPRMSEVKIDDVIVNDPEIDIPKTDIKVPPNDGSFGKLSLDNGVINEIVSRINRKLQAYTPVNFSVSEIPKDRTDIQGINVDINTNIRIDNVELKKIQSDINIVKPELPNINAYMNELIDSISRKKK